MHHHNLGLVIEVVFFISDGTKSDILLFKRFQAQWEHLDKSQFQASADNEEVLQLIGDQKSNTLEWPKMAVEQQKQLQDDYTEDFNNLALQIIYFQA